MKHQVEIWNGSGWNNYQGLRELKTLQVGTRGLMAKNGVERIEVSPRDEERPYGIAARYFDAEGELLFTQGFDQNDSAKWIRERIYALLVEGIQNRIGANRARIHREAFTKQVTAWRRNFDAQPPKDMSGLLRAKMGAFRAATGKHSRKYCWMLTREIQNGMLSWAEALAKFGLTPQQGSKIWAATQIARNHEAVVAQP